MDTCHARLIFDESVSIQVPPNLSPGMLRPLLDAGINDWGGVSPLTPDHVNPEAPWPHLDVLSLETEKAGKTLAGRLTVYPPYIKEQSDWIDERFHTAIYHGTDSEALARHDDWSPGTESNPPIDLVERIEHRSPHNSSEMDVLLDKAGTGKAWTEGEVASLFRARRNEFSAVVACADELRISQSGSTVTYAVNRNINYTNICYFGCTFCAFSKGKNNAQLRGKPYDIGLQEIVRRSREAWDRGATEVCLQGGIHPSYTGQTYLEICRAINEALPDMHIHAFSALEISQGAETLGLSVPTFLNELKDAGLGSMPGTAAEVLDDRVRTQICPDKLSTGEWLEVIEAAHQASIDTTATIMFGHIDGPENWARHLLNLRKLQEKSLAFGRGKFTEFVPLPFVHMEAPMYLKGQARKGPTFREAILMHAVARIVLGDVIPNTQVSWAKMGGRGVALALRAGVNDLGGTLMNESISKAAGSSHGQEMTPEQMIDLIGSMGRTPKRRSTTYGDVDEERLKASFSAPALGPVSNDIVKRDKVGENLMRTVIEAAE